MGGSRLLTADKDDDGQTIVDEPVRIFSLKKHVWVGRTKMRIQKGVHLIQRARRAWAQDKANGHTSQDIIQRTPAIIMDTRLNDTQDKGSLQLRRMREGVAWAIPRRTHS